MAKTKRTDEDWLSDIVHWGERMSSYLAGIDQAAFERDLRTQDAVIRCLECIGEASHHLKASAAADQFSELELAEAYWTRNRIMHGYYDLSAARIWSTASGPAAKFVEKARLILKAKSAG